MALPEDVTFSRLDELLVTLMVDTSEALDTFQKLDVDAAKESTGSLALAIENWLLLWVANVK